MPSKARPRLVLIMDWSRKKPSIIFSISNKGSDIEIFKSASLIWPKCWFGNHELYLPAPVYQSDGTAAFGDRNVGV